MLLRGASRPAYLRVPIVYGVVSLLLWTVPLLSILHVESAAVVATVAFFAGGLSSLALFQAGLRARRVLLLQEAALVIPWALLTVSVLWQPNCDYARGLLFFAAFPGITVVFAVALAGLIYALPVGGKRTWLILAGAILLVGPTIYDVGFHPQFYTYNHIFGGVLGPIYDEQLAVRPGLVAFRVLTLCWAGLFAALMSVLEERSARGRSVAAGIGVIITAVYVMAPRLGIVTTYDRISDQLGGVRRTEHFEIYFDETNMTDEELRRLADEHEYRFAVLEERLGTFEAHGPIRSYIYPNADVKAALTGARTTNVAPVWLRYPQMHLLKADAAAVLPHELVHVFSRDFGLPILRASLAVGLVEGLAVALEPPDGRPDPDEQVSAAILAGHLRESVGTQALEEIVASHLAPLGFWTGRGAVSYTAMGSFVRYLLDTYGAEPLREAYPMADFEGAYGRSASELAAEWTDHVLGLHAVARSAAALVGERFAVPSLFEKDCPHYLPAYRRALMDGRRALAAGDSAAAFRRVAAALDIEPNYAQALGLWARLALRQGRVDGVTDRLGAVDERYRTASLDMLLGDALALQGRDGEAADAYRAAKSMLPLYAHESTARIALREALLQRGGAIRILLDPEPSGAASGDAVERMAGALTSARRGDYEHAITLLRTTSLGVAPDAGSPILGELGRRRLVWLSDLHYALGRLDIAAAYADSAGAAYGRVGAFNESEAMEDRVRKLSWLARPADGPAGMTPPNP